MIVESVVIQHAEEAAFLWLLRDAAVRAPHYTLDDLAKLDNRVEAHIDGLRVAGDAGWEVVRGELKWEEPGEIFAGAVLAFGTNDGARIEAVLAAAVATPELSRGLISALGWLPHESVAARINQLITASDPNLRRVGIAAAAIHRRDPGQSLIDCLASDDPAIRSRALKAVGELGRADLLPQVRCHLNAGEAGCRLWASWSAAVLGDAAAVPHLRELVEADLPYAERALQVALRRMGQPEALSWLDQMKKDSRRLRRAVIATGIVGDPVSVPWLLEQMPAADVARVAGEEFTMITGIDLALADLETDAPQGLPAGPTENPEDENVALDPDEDLPWPDPGLVREWWNNHRKDYLPGTRHLCGRPISADSLNEILRTGMQRQRVAAALELAMRQSGPKRAPLFEVRAPGFRQQRLLAPRQPKG